MWFLKCCCLIKCHIQWNGNVLLWIVVFSEMFCDFFSSKCCCHCEMSLYLLKCSAFKSSNVMLCVFLCFLKWCLLKCYDLQGHRTAGFLFLLLSLFDINKEHCEKNKLFAQDCTLLIPDKHQLINIHMLLTGASLYRSHFQQAADVEAKSVKVDPKRPPVLFEVRSDLDGLRSSPRQFRWLQICIRPDKIKQSYLSMSCSVEKHSYFKNIYKRTSALKGHYVDLEEKFKLWYLQY